MIVDDDSSVLLPVCRGSRSLEVWTSSSGGGGGGAFLRRFRGRFSSSTFDDDDSSHTEEGGSCYVMLASGQLPMEKRFGKTISRQ